MTNSNLTLTHFRVLNFRNIDDSEPIPVERITAFVGRNESGKTSLLKALHKFNPAIEEPYNAQREFPRDRFTSEYEDGADWPVCAATFTLSEAFRTQVGQTLNDSEPPTTVTCTRYYDGGLEFEYDTVVSDDPVPPAELDDALKTLEKAARRLDAPTPEQEEATQAQRTALATWAAQKREPLKNLQDLKTATGVALLAELRDEGNAHSTSISADLLDAFQDIVTQLTNRAVVEPLPDQINALIEEALPVFIYFENYGILDSAVYLPRLLEDIASSPDDPRIRTINAMFKHVRLTAQEITELGRESAAPVQAAGQKVTAEMIAEDQQRKELRSVKLNSASLDITKKFTAWFRSRRHKIRYQADGDYFRIWVSDDRRPGVDIELESRSKGFQWFFSFYLRFLVESIEGHKDAILLLDEPGLHLHPTAQQELIEFFDELAEKNSLMYTTHSPFLIDGEHIHRVRPVTEDETGHSSISVNGWPRDRETIFPLQAAAGYAMVRGLFQHKKNVLVEGMSDYLYLHGLNLYCRALGRPALPDDIYITPCGGTKLVGHLASLFLGQEVRPVVLLDGDDAGRVRRDALMKELYTGREKAVLMLSDVLGQEECETEDILGESLLLSTLNAFVTGKITLNQDDRKRGSVVDHIKSAALRHNVELPEGWKAEVARRIVVAWSTADPKDIPVEILDRAEALFKELNQRFDGLIV